MFLPYRHTSIHTAHGTAITEEESYTWVESNGRGIPVVAEKGPEIIQVTDAISPLGGRMALTRECLGDYRVLDGAKPKAHDLDLEYAILSLALHPKYGMRKGYTYRDPQPPGKD